MLIVFTRCRTSKYFSRDLVFKEKVAGRIKHGIGGAKELKSSIEVKLPADLTGLIDVFALDVSKP
ncbi:hypothetical protein [Spartinivicinus poritis]|uniref:Uncharacterized protein n=1 Tax=Spartinivicinus poritis TaxID=2994640 RepID=A0ABT5UFP5_9GAMM|nr:hypothetical protein [Spartinivicinus sp. A2-2]MDE1465202.1 hypothetical protein [Spartinivicinus sp. A2-2]